MTVVQPVFEAKHQTDQQIFDFLAGYPHGITRGWLARFLNLPRSTTYDVLVRLQLRGLVKRMPLIQKTRGRRPIRWVRVS